MANPARRPRELVLGGVVYEVRDGETGDGDTHAITDLLRCRITMRDERPPSAQRVDLFHEVMHAAWHAAGLHQAAKPLADAEEQLIAALAPQLVVALQRNPGLLTWLTAE